MQVAGKPLSEREYHTYVSWRDVGIGLDEVGAEMPRVTKSILQLLAKELVESDARQSEIILAACRKSLVLGDMASLIEDIIWTLEDNKMPSSKTENESKNASQ